MLMRRINPAIAGLWLAASGVCHAQTPAAPAAPATVSLPVPVMSGPLALSPVPPAIDAGPLGTFYVDGAFTALGLAQTNAVGGDRAAAADASNAQVFIQKIDGLVRVYAQLGAYALPALGQTYAHAADTTDAWEHQFGPVPQAFVKIAPSDAISIQAGKLPSLLGAEYTFTFENVNIVRGLLCTQGPSVSRGVQANYITGALAFSLSLNDGFYAGRYNWLSGSASWTIDPANLLVFAAGANMGRTATNTLVTPRAQNNSAVYNLIYTYTKGDWMLSPYLQVTEVPANPRIGIAHGAATYGAAVLGTYAFAKNFSLGARVEYETSSARGQLDRTNLLFGPGSSAASFTLTPTYMHDHWFVRADLAAVALTHAAHGDAFGRDGNATTQLRGLLEAGYIF